MVTADDALMRFPFPNAFACMICCLRPPVSGICPMGDTSTGLKVNVVRAASYADSGHSRAFTQPGRTETRRLSIPCCLAVASRAR